MSDGRPSKGMPKLSEVFLSEPSKAGVAPEDKAVGREDQIQSFTDFTNEALPMSERMDALSFFIELSMESGPALPEPLDTEVL